MENLVTPASNNRVTIAATAGEWHVSVHQDGKKAIIIFLVEHHAVSFADGQKIRLRQEDGCRGFRPAVEASHRPTAIALL